VIPGQRPDLHDVDLVVGVCWPTVRSHLSPHASDDSFGVCTVQPADGGSFSFPVDCGRDRAALWEALHGAYVRRDRFRAAAQ
jgi:hypothetical protein